MAQTKRRKRSAASIAKGVATRRANRERAAFNTEGIHIGNVETVRLPLAPDTHAPAHRERKMIDADQLLRIVAAVVNAL